MPGVVNLIGQGSVRCGLASLRRALLEIRGNCIGSKVDCTGKLAFQHRCEPAAPSHRTARRGHRDGRGAIVPQVGIRIPVLTPPPRLRRRDDVVTSSRPPPAPR